MWHSIYESEPDVWFHDAFRKEGSPFDNDEILLIKNLTNNEN